MAARFGDMLLEQSRRMGAMGPAFQRVPCPIGWDL